MRKPILLGILMLCTIGLTFAQNLSNIEVNQVNKTIEINYSLKQKADIAVKVSVNGGRTFNKMRKTTGDVGKNIFPGRNKIVWKVLEEYPRFVEDNVVFMVSASNNEKKNIASNPQKKNKPSTYKPKNNDYSRCSFLNANVSWASEPQWAFGLSFGQYERVGWYASFMSNFILYGLVPDYVCDKNGFIGGELQFYSGKKSTTRISLTAGVIYKFLQPWGIYAGAGFGYRALLWKTIDGSWVRNSYFSTIGVDVESGFLFDIKRFTLSVGVVTTNFKRLEVKAGIGFTFKKY
jgi:opacity protein-like surface antigen